METGVRPREGRLDRGPGGLATSAVSGLAWLRPSCPAVLSRFWTEEGGQRRARLLFGALPCVRRALGVTGRCSRCSLLTRRVFLLCTLSVPGWHFSAPPVAVEGRIGAPQGDHARIPRTCEHARRHGRGTEAGDGIMTEGRWP